MRSASMAAVCVALLAAALCVPCDGLFAQKSARQATLAGRVLSDPAERPLAGATLTMPALGLQVTTDSLGRFRLSGIEPGRQLLTVSQVGFATLQTHMAFAVSDTMEADILLSPSATNGAQAVAAVSVTADAIPLGLEDFTRRRRTVSGDFFDEEMIRKTAHGQFSDVIRRIPGVQLTRSNGGYGTFASAGRGATRGRPCFASVMIDRSWVYEGKRGELPFDLNSIAPESIAGVEFYRGLASVPAEFGKQLTTCGTLIIWTKRG